MLLNEIKRVFETDREPTLGALQALGVNLGARGDKDSAGAGDLPDEIRPLLETHVLTTNPPDLKESELTSKFNTPEKMAKGHKGFLKLQANINRLRENFQTKVGDLDRMTEVAKGAELSPKTPDAWFGQLKAHSAVNAPNDINDSDGVPGVNTLFADTATKTKLLQALMRVQTAETWVDLAANDISKQLSKTPKLPETQASVDEKTRKMIRVFYSMLHFMSENSLALNRAFETFQTKVKGEAPTS